jgi:LPXTG-site transpeptidase (sortase) family protein
VGDGAPEGLWEDSLTSKPIRTKFSAIISCLMLASLLVTACQPVTRSDAGAANVLAVEAASAPTLTVQPTLPAAPPASPTLLPEASPVAVALQPAPLATPSATSTPTTTAPATTAPATTALTVSAPATTVPSTAAPTVSAPTTAAPSTAAPTVSAPTTAALAVATTAGSGVRFSAGSAINVRAGPGTSYAALGQLAAGNGYAVSGTNAARDWLQFTYQGQDGWVSAGIVQIQGNVKDLAILKDVPAPPPGRVVAPTINLDSKVIPVGWHTEQTAGGPVDVWDVAAYAAGWLINSAKPGQVGNVVLSGHHNILGEVFRYVVNLKVGDPITIYAGGTAYNYQVTDNFILADKYVSDQQRLDNGKWIGQFPDERLTLVTCWPYTNNTHRVIVIAKPVK